MKALLPLYRQLEGGCVLGTLAQLNQPELLPD